MYTRTKRLFQYSLATMISALLTLGMASSASAVSAHSGKIFIKRICNGDPKFTVEKINADVTMIITPADPSGFVPFFTLQLAINHPRFRFDFNGSGVAVSKNNRRAETQATVSSIDGQDLSIAGRFIFNPKSQDVIKTENKVRGMYAGGRCIFEGKFKTKILPVVPF